MDENITYKVRIKGQMWSELFVGSYKECQKWAEDNKFEAYVYEIVPLVPPKY